MYPLFWQNITINHRNSYYICIWYMYNKKKRKENVPCKIVKIKVKQRFHHQHFFYENKGKKKNAFGKYCIKKCMGDNSPNMFFIKIVHVKKTWSDKIIASIIFMIDSQIFIEFTWWFLHGSKISVTLKA